MTLLSPIWLVLGLPALIAAWLWRGGSRLAWCFRLLGLALVLLALSGLATQQVRRAGILIAIADRSLSMPKDKEQRQQEWIDQLHKKMGPLEKLGVVSFGRQALVEHAPQRNKFPGFTRRVEGDGSALGEALQVALALIPTGHPGRIVLMSDGRWTGRDPAVLAARAAARGISIDYVSLQRPAAGDIAVGRIEAPDGVAPGEAFMLSAWVHVPTSQRVRFVLKRGALPLVVGTKLLKAGANRLLFRDQADKQGVLAYQLTLSPAPGAGKATKDPSPENNKARFLVGVKGPRPILHLTTSGRSALAALLKSGKLDVVSKKPGKFSYSLKDLAQYSAILLENVPSQHIGRTGMQNIVSWVKNTGAGLLITGGEQSFGVGGYIRSPLEPILPVTMRLKQEHRKLFLSLAIVLDRSCSMGARVDGGRSKMDLANIASAQALSLLGPQDELGVLAVDTRPHEILRLSQITDKAALKQKILSIRPSGGGIYVYEGLQAALRMLKHATSKTRHIILFSDTNDSERPGAYTRLLQECADNGITVSVIGLGGPTDRDSALLKDIAKKGKGRIFFTRNAKELPRLFAQDTMMVTKSSFARKKVGVRWLPAGGRLTRLSFPSAPTIGGYNMTYPRPGATLAMVTVEKKPAPLVAAWQVGLGRVLAYTGEVDGAHAGDMARWERVGDLLSSLVRWTSGSQQRLPTPMMMTQRLRKGKGIIELELDPERFSALLARRPTITLLKGDLGRKPRKSQVKMRWVAPHRLQVAVPMRGRETVLPTLLLPGMDPIALAPMILPYSPEFRPADMANPTDRGKSKQRRKRTDLAALARITQGQVRIGMAGIWRAIPIRKVTAPIGHWLLLLVVFLLLFEILERRAGFLVDLVHDRFRRKPKVEATPISTPASYGLETKPAYQTTSAPPRSTPAMSPTAAAIASTRTATPTAPVVSAPVAPTAPATQSPVKKPDPPKPAAKKPAKKPKAPAPRSQAPAPEAPAAGGMFGAMQKASAQAKRRTERKPKK